MYVTGQSYKSTAQQTSPALCFQNWTGASTHVKSRDLDFTHQHWPDQEARQDA